MFMLDIKDTAWWYWLASTTCLWLAIAVDPFAFQLALGIGVVQLVHFALGERSMTAFPVQNRIGYLLVLLSAMPEMLSWMIWVPAIGTALRVLFGYCLMARILMLMPFNRTRPLSWRFVRDAFLTPPVPGNILHGFTAA